MSADYVADNDRERGRLVSLLDGLGESDLNVALSNGKSVAATLLHLAFWDEYCAALLEQWAEGGISVSQSNYDALNASIDYIASAVPVSVAPALARQPPPGQMRQQAHCPLHSEMRRFELGSIASCIARYTDACTWIRSKLRFVQAVASSFLTASIEQALLADSRKR